MSTEENKALVRRLLEETWNNGNLDVSDELVSADCVLHYQGRSIPAGGAAGKGIVTTWRTAFPDFEFLFEDMIAEGETVAARIPFRGTHLGTLFGIAPTGRQITITETLILRLANGKVVEMWEDFDQLGLLRQLGALPS